MTYLVLRVKDAEAVLKLQAGFRRDYALKIEHISFLEYLLDSRYVCVKLLCRTRGLLC